MADKTPPKKVRGVYEHPKGSNFWWIQYFWNGRHREPVGRRSDAIALREKRMTEKRQGEKLPELQRRRVTVGELLDDVITFAESRHKSAKDYKQKAELVRSAFGTRAADSVTSADVESFIAKRKVSNATFNRYRAFFSLCFKLGMQSGKLKANVARLIGQKREPRGRHRFLEREKEYPNMLAKLTEKYPARVDAFVFSVFSGARLSEQFRLRWRDVDFDRNEATFRDTKHGEDRTVPLNSITRGILLDLRPEKPNPRASVFGSMHRFCCTTKPEGPIKTDNSGNSPKWFRELAEGLGIHDYTWHSNRHTFCSWLAIAGTPLRTIQELAGHKSIAVTARYAHLSPDHKQSEIERLVAAPGPQKVKQWPSQTGTD